VRFGSFAMRPLLAGVSSDALKAYVIVIKQKIMVPQNRLQVRYIGRRAFSTRLPGVNNNSDVRESVLSLYLLREASTSILKEELYCAVGGGEKLPPLDRS
jgi:hypothetical protein